MYTMIGAGGQGAGAGGIGGKHCNALQLTFHSYISYCPGKGVKGLGKGGPGRINHHREKSFMEKLGRPSRILLKPGLDNTSHLDPEASAHTSRSVQRRQMVSNISLVFS